MGIIAIYAPGQISVTSGWINTLVLSGTGGGTVPSQIVSVAEGPWGQPISSVTSNTTPTFSTTGPGVLLAIITAQGSSTTVSSVTGGGLTWYKGAGGAVGSGCQEIWWANATTALTNVQITAVIGANCDFGFGVVRLSGANTSAPVGMTINASRQTTVTDFVLPFSGLTSGSMVFGTCFTEAPYAGPSGLDAGTSQVFLQNGVAAAFRSTSAVGGSTANIGENYSPAQAAIDGCGAEILGEGTNGVFGFCDRNSPPTGFTEDSVGVAQAQVSCGRIQVPTGAGGKNVTSILAYKSANFSDTTGARGVIYADSAGSPGSLLATSTNEVTSATANTWVEFNFSGYTLPADGTWIWFGLFNGNGGAAFYVWDQAATTASFAYSYPAPNTYPSAPDPFNQNGATGTSSYSKAFILKWSA